MQIKVGALILERNEHPPVSQLHLQSRFWSFWFWCLTFDSKSISSSESQWRQTNRKADTKQCSHPCSICTAGKVPFPSLATPSPQNITADTSNQVGRRLLWLNKARVNACPDSTGWQGDAMPFISSTNIYLENKRQALGHMYFSFLPRYICLPNEGCYLCPYALACLWCLRPSWPQQPQPLGETAVFTSA